MDSINSWMKNNVVIKSDSQVTGDHIANHCTGPAWQNVEKGLNWPTCKNMWWPTECGEYGLHRKQLSEQEGSVLFEMTGVSIQAGVCLVTDEGHLQKSQIRLVNHPCCAHW